MFIAPQLQIKLKINLGVNRPWDCEISVTGKCFSSDIHHDVHEILKNHSEPLEQV